MVEERNGPEEQGDFCRAVQKEAGWVDKSKVWKPALVRVYMKQPVAPARMLHLYVVHINDTMTWITYC